MECGSNQAFQDLKTTFIIVPILIHPNFSKPFFLKNNASDYVLKAILFQKEMMNNFTLLHFIHKSSQLQRSIMKFMIKNFSHCRVFPRMEIFSWRNCPSNYILLRPYEPRIFHVYSGIESMSSSLEPIIISLQLYDYVSPWFPIRSIRCVVKIFISYT